jgi:hypothetical protein
MEKQFTWYHVTKITPDDTRHVIIQAANFPDPTFGFFNPKTRKWTISDINLRSNREQDEIDIVVVAWMEMPEPYDVLSAPPLEFRSAEEARQLMDISSKRVINDEVLSFYKVRRSIQAAAERNWGSCRIEKEDITPLMIDLLEEKDYVIEDDPDKDFVIVKWA